MRHCIRRPPGHWTPHRGSAALAWAAAALLASAASAAPPPPPPAGDAAEPDEPADDTEAPAVEAPASPPPAAPAAPADADVSVSAATSTPSAATKPLDPSLQRPSPNDPNAPPDYVEGFHFGSYGRVVTGGDGTGRAGRNADIVGRGSRLDESTYAELEVRREDYWEATGAYTRMVMTVAFANPIFHYNGNFDAGLAIRNLYIEAADIGVKGLRVWMGSRMYRGDDIYLLNFWALDNLNTMGGGVGYWFPTRTVLKLHAGLNQPNSGWFRQTIDRPSVHNQLGATQVALLDRQKLISSAKLEHTIPLGLTGGLKLTGYGEFHYTNAAQRELKDQIYEDLPADKGFVAGAQVSAFTGKRSTHINLVARYARGLAAYGEFNAPVQLAPDRTSKGAQELLFAAGGNYEAGPFGVMMGSYYRMFRNAAQGLDYNDLNEGIFILRPQIWLGKRRIAGIAVEGSYQAQQRGVDVVDDQGGIAPLFAQVGRFGFIPFLSPGGQGAFTRPHFQFIYLLTGRDAAARSLYVAEDVFARRGIDHFIGITAEWWFGSTSYFRD